MVNCVGASLANFMVNLPGLALQEGIGLSMNSNFWSEPGPFLWNSFFNTRPCFLHLQHQLLRHITARLAPSAYGSSEWDKSVVQTLWLYSKKNLSNGYFPLSKLLAADSFDARLVPRKHKFSHAFKYQPEIGGISKTYKTEHRVCGIGQLIKANKSQLIDY